MKQKRPRKSSTKQEKKGASSTGPLDSTRNENDFIRSLLSKLDKEDVSFENFKELRRELEDADEGYILEEGIFRAVQEIKILSRLMNLRGQLEAGTKTWTESKLKRIIHKNREQLELEHDYTRGNYEDAIRRRDWHLDIFFSSRPFLRKSFEGDHVTIEQQISFVQKTCLHYEFRKKTKKITPIDITQSSTKSRKRYLHMEILQTIPLIKEIEPMSIEEIRGIPYVDQCVYQEMFGKFRKKEKKYRHRDRKKKKGWMIFQITWQAEYQKLNNEEMENYFIRYRKVIDCIVLKQYKFHLFSFSPTVHVKFLFFFFNSLYIYNLGGLTGLKMNTNFNYIIILRAFVGLYVIEQGKTKGG